MAGGHTVMIASLLVMAALALAASAYESSPAGGIGMKTAAQETAGKAAEYARGAGEAAESWADWAREKVTEGLGLRHENARLAAEHIRDKAGDIAMKTKEMMSGAASGAADHTSKKAGEAKDAMMDMAGDASDKMADGAGEAADSAAQAYETAKQKVGEAYETARDTMTRGAKEGYEAAKEKMSQAVGDKGTGMEEL